MGWMFGFPECVGNGSRLTLEVWRLESCVTQRCKEATASDRRVPATRSLSLTIVRRSQRVIRMMCSRPISLQISAFVPFCDVRGGSVCVLRGWRNTLDLWQAQHFVLLHFAISLHISTRHPGEIFGLLKRSGRAAHT